ncbi:MAG: prepilin-type N-terminal cleavage/methylation domain-containing protein [Candidatus Eremiobacteraeota bacterium]|nr:prepilin-type N-terminal cleavage/methylation domain-containing protein [Candidatus Eremiobacteraeota bacterium]
MPVKRKSKGFTLAEVMSYMGVLLIIILFAGTFVINSLKYYRLIDIETTLQQRLLVSMSHISHDLSVANRNSLQIEQNGMIFASPRNAAGGFSFASDGSLYWQKWVCYFIKNSGDDKILVKKEIPISSPSVDPGSPPFDTVSQFSGASVPERKISDGVRTFTVENAGYAGGYKVSLLVDMTTDSTRLNQIQGVTEILIRN